MSVVSAAHDRVFRRRVRVLAHHLAALLPRGARVLDVGCGDGSIAGAIGRLRPDVSFQGLDVLVRGSTAIPVERFDGRTIPLGDDGADCVMFVDVLHHADDAPRLLREARRVAPFVVVKDHLAEGFLAGPTLRLMDWVGNSRHGVSLPYRYWTRSEWDRQALAASLSYESRVEQLALYPWPASLAFDRSLHFVARLARR